MGLRLIYGKAGTGKSTFCFNEIKKYVQNGEKIFIITPEQFSYSAEKKLLEVLDNKASINAEVISFNRLANRVFTEVGGLNSKLLSKSARSMLVYDILENEKNNLQFLGNSNDNIDLVLNEISELKKHDLTSKKIEDNLEKIQDISVKEKLTELNKIYKKYNEKLANQYIDEEDILTKLFEKIPESTIFNDAIVYIDEFSGFTKQEYNIFTEILKKAKEVNVIICSDDLNNNTQKENDIFYFNKKFANQLKECEQIINNNNLSTKCGQNVDKKSGNYIFLKNQYRFKNDELIFLEENLFKNKYEKYNKKNNNIKLFIAKNNYTEIEYVAEEINKLIREKNYKYNDIAIITKNINDINNIIKAVFSKYNIPVFIDEKAEITENILIKHILSILEIFSTNWNSEAVFSYIKSGLLNIENDKIYKIENYCKKNRNK